MSESKNDVQELRSPWEGDLLGYERIGTTFSNLIRSIDDSKVLSIEAGFGRGKTFFRKAWAQHLRDEGEVVVEIDAQLSDHSGDPVVTFIGALLEAVPKEDKPRRKKALEKGKKIAGLAGKAALGYVAKSVANEIVEDLTEKAEDQVEGMETLEAAVEDMGQGLSKLAGRLIEAQLAAEQVRQKELPEQLSALRDTLTQEVGTNRVVILIDELDRCHPEYAIALLEAMKLVFTHEGYVFCLMVNSDYLENLAAHRFGATGEGERYLDKFVDVRLKLPNTAEVRAAAARQLALELPLEFPYGNAQAFSLDAAAELAWKIVSEHDLSMRQIKRVFLRVELALRCYRDQAIDCPMLVFFAFRDATRRAGDGSFGLSKDLLPRAKLTPQKGQEMGHSDEFGRQSKTAYASERYFKDNAPELFSLPIERYNLPDDQNYYDWAKVGSFLAPTYIQKHKDMLDAVRDLEVSTDA